MHVCASSGVRKLEDVAGVARRSVVGEVGVLSFVGANALAEDAIAIKMAKLACVALIVQVVDMNDYGNRQVEWTEVEL